MIIFSVLLFGGCFALNDMYRKMRGSSIKISLQFSVISSFAGLLVLFILNNFKFEYTHFTLIIALLSAINSLAFIFCGFKALEFINLSLYSLFSMLGGMALPFLQGILFYNESITVGKTVCFVLIVIALILTVKKDNKRSGIVYYIGIFIFNGMSGVCQKYLLLQAIQKQVLPVIQY